MFGLALRTYQKKMQRLTASVTEPERTLWQAVLDVLVQEGSVSRARLLRLFARDGEKETIGVLTDLVNSGLAYTSGRGPSMLYGTTSSADQQRMSEAQGGDAIANMMCSVDWPYGEESAAHVAWIREYWRRLEPFTQGFYINDQDPDATASDVDTNEGKTKSPAMTPPGMVAF